MTNEQIIARALSAYRRQCTKDGAAFQQPAPPHAKRLKDGSIQVELRNVNGPLALYELKAGAMRLRRVS